MSNEFERSWSDADGWTVRIYRKYESMWISVNTPGRPARSSSFNPEITAVTFNPYLEGLAKLGKDPADYRQAGTLIRKTAVPFVESVIAELRALKEGAAEALKRNVPGLDELRAAIRDESRYAEEFERMMDDGHNDGVRPPRPVAAKSSDVAVKYPVAAAYLKAEAWEVAGGHDVKASAGRRAKERIAAGENHEQALLDMEAQWAAHVKQQAWD